MTSTTDEESFYNNAKKYWEKVPATVDGMLGGFSEITYIDAQESVKFFKPLVMKYNIGSDGSPTRVLDCGAGIGRVTKLTLSRFFDKVDMVEQCQTFLDNAREYLGPDVSNKVENLFCSGLQDFIPEPEHYDVIWIQWVLGHLTDSALVEFLKRCKKGLKHNGMIIVKENMTSTEETDVDEKDSSVTRPRSLLEYLFSEAHLSILHEKVQPRMPAGLYTVRMFALK